MHWRGRDTTQLLRKQKPYSMHTIETDATDNKKYSTLNKVERCNYLGSIISENCGCEEEVRHRLGAGKWWEISGIACYKKMPNVLKVAVYRPSSCLF